MTDSDVSAEHLRTAEMLSYTEAAAFLGLPVGTLYTLVHERRIPHVRLGPRLVRFPRAELALWIAGNLVPARSER